MSGLTAAALLARAGRRVQVLEGHVVPGGCASYYQREGYRFDVGATLVSGFGTRGVHRLIFERLGIALAAEPVEPAMVVHIGSERIVRYGDDRWRGERRRVFGESAEPFWREQERIADLAWDFSTRFPALPTDIAGVRALLAALRPRQLGLIGTLGRTVSDIMPRDASRLLRAFVDAQLLITAQADAGSTDLAYGATALDIAREGTFHLASGVSEIAEALARAVRTAGGQIAYGTPARAIEVERGRIAGVRLADGSSVRAPHVVAAIPVQNVAELLGAHAPDPVRRAVTAPQRWGAFMAYVGLPPALVPDDLALHQQIVMDPAAPLGEGNSVFVSFSAAGEIRRARGGGRTVTLSTHTDVSAWERAYADGSYDARKGRYRARLRAAFERVLPGVWERADVIDCATPHTFATYTGRSRGLVGGVPQTPHAANLRAVSHSGGIPGLVLAGDTVFPGQSTVGASLSGAAAARAVLA
ncbi:MAG: C-3',4' desaturase CrtD [Candidatus Velthaea sp.]